ncbi:MAG TPA: cytochrome c oxidase subunit II [Usitatibacter sp.]|nr:cytochrome c oxidase subunit II [Usitatibacter sp.]
MHRRFLRALVALAATLPLSLAAFASYDVDILPPASPAELDAYHLHWGIMWVCIAIFFIVFGAMFWSIFRHRKSVGAKAAQFHENTTIEVVWTIIPFLVLIGMAYPATKTMLEMKDTSGADMTIKVTAYQWRWEYGYPAEGIDFYSNLATPRDQIDDYSGHSAAKNTNYLLEVDKPMVVPTGKKVRLLITANDVIHGWYVPQLGVNQYGIPGFVKDVWFEVSQPGIYRGQCSQICGKEHGFMPIVVDARTPDAYAAWVKEEKAKMPPPSAPAAAEAPATAPAAPTPVAEASAAPAGKMTLAELKAKGEKVYMTNCSACHQPSGKGMPPAFPALDGSKTVNGPKEAHILTVLNGRPGTAMASWARLPDAEIAEVVTYERNSWGNKTGDAIQPAEVAAARKHK